MASDSEPIIKFLSPPPRPLQKSHFGGSKCFSTAVLQFQYKKTLANYNKASINDGWSSCNFRGRGPFTGPWTLSKQMFRGGRQVFQVGQAPSGPTIIRPLVVTTGAVRRAKLQSNCHHQQTNTQLGWLPFLSPNQQCRSTCAVNKATPLRSLCVYYRQMKWCWLIYLLITLRASCGAVYCNRSCLCVCGSVTMITWNCLHRSSPNWVCM